MALHSINKLTSQHQLLTCLNRPRSEERESAARVQSLQPQVAVRSVDLASACGDLTCLEESITVAQRQFINAQSAYVTVDGERDECRRCLGVEEQRRGGLEALLSGLCSRLVDHSSSVD